MKLRAKIWIERGGEHLFGRGRAELLEAVQREGSIQAAAEKMGVSYRHAWTMLKTSEQRWGKKLVETTRGGTGGGGARVTKAGRRLLDAFRRIESRLEELIKEQQGELDRAGI